MVATVAQLIAAINPDKYFKPSAEDEEEAQKELEEFKKIINEKGIAAAAEKAKVQATSEHMLVYDSSSETLEPIYFFIIDLMNELGLKPEKLIDNFASSPGSGHFSELGQKASAMQQQVSSQMQTIGVLTKSVIQLIYDLKEFNMFLEQYDDIKSKNKSTAEAALLSLKQRWLDRVDIQKGNSAVKAMALGQAGFQTLLDGFLVVKDESLKGPDGKEIDLNDRVKRILQSRIQEFNTWVEQSEIEIRKRYKLQLNYLKSQVNSLKLYARWVKPYLKAAQQLETKDFGRNPALVKVFNTLILELTLLGKSKLKPKELAIEGRLPAEFEKMKFDKDYFGCVLVDFNFRGIPQKAGQHYVFGGRVEVSFKAFALNNQELKRLDEELDDSDLAESLKLMSSLTEENLAEIQKELDGFLEQADKSEKEEKKEKKSESADNSSNPFLALIGKYDSGSSEKKDAKKKDKKTKIDSESWIEKNHLRTLAEDDAKEKAFTVFDVYKKGHGMPSFEKPFKDY